MILTLLPAYIGGSFGVEFVLAVTRIRPSALGRAFFRSGSAVSAAGFAADSAAD
jgi:hypothetical protein